MEVWSLDNGPWLEYFGKIGNGEEVKSSLPAAFSFDAKDPTKHSSMGRDESETSLLASSTTGFLGAFLGDDNGKRVLSALLIYANEVTF